MASDIAAVFDVAKYLMEEAVAAAATERHDPRSGHPKIRRRSRAARKLCGSFELYAVRGDCN
jgi:hypothetical protein